MNLRLKDPFVAAGIQFALALLSAATACGQYPVANLTGAPYTTGPYAGHTSPLLVGQCTWFVYGRIQEAGLISSNKLASQGIFLHSAGTSWVDDAINAGYSTGSQPRQGAIAVWTTGVGHVAFVESVVGGVAQFSECNATPMSGWNVVVCRDAQDQGGWSVSLRDAPSTSGNIVGNLPKFNLFSVVDGPTPGDGYYWYHLQGSGYDGWSALLNIDTGNGEDPTDPGRSFTWSFTRIKLQPSSSSIARLESPDTYIYLTASPPNSTWVISILGPQNFSYIAGSPVTIQGVVEDGFNVPIAGATVFAEDSFYRQSRIVGTTGADGAFELLYDAIVTQSAGPGVYPIILVVGKARTTVVINLQPSSPGLFTANTLQLNLGLAGAPILLTQDTLVFSPRIADSTIPVLTDDQVLDSAMKLSREAGVWLATEGREFISNPVNDIALGLTVSCVPVLGGPANPICPASVQFVAESLGQQLALDAGHAIINQAPNYNQQQRDEANQFLDRIGLGISLLGLKTDGTLLDDLSLFSATWDTLNAAMETIASPSGDLVGLDLVGLGNAGQETRILSCRLLPADAAQNYSMTVSASQPAAGSVSGAGIYPDAANVTVLAAANPGYSFLNWTEGGIEVTNSPSYTFVSSSNRTLVANFTAIPPAPCLDPNEPNDSSLTATPLTPGTPLQGLICTTNDVDWFKVNVTERGTLTFNLTVPARNDYDLELYGPDTYYITGSYNDVGEAETISYNATATGDYYVRVYGYPAGNGSFNTSSNYTLAADFNSGAITIVSQPQDLIVIEGASAVFSVTASGTQLLGYQWEKNGAPPGGIPGANLATYATPPVTLADSGAQFRVIITNAFGAVTSAWATLTVNTANTITWIGAAGNGDWLNPINWIPQTVPTANDAVQLNGVSLYVPPNSQWAVLNFNGGSLSGTFTNSGTINWTGGYLNGQMTVAPGAVLNLSGDADKTVVYNGAVNNAGTINWAGAGNLLANNVCFGGGPSTLNNLAGGTLNLNSDAGFGLANSCSWWQVSNAGLMLKASGTGTSLFTCYFSNTGTVDVERGTLSFSGSYGFDTGTTQVGIASLSDFGRLVLSGTAAFAGDFAVTFANGYRPNAGDSFQVISYPSHSGAFSTMRGLVLGGLDLNPVYGSGSLTLIAVADNRALLSSAALLTNGTFQFQVSGAAGMGYLVQASTNLADWWPIYTNITGGQFPFTDAQASNAPQRFYRAVLQP